MTCSLHAHLQMFQKEAEKVGTRAYGLLRWPQMLTLLWASSCSLVVTVNWTVHRADSVGISDVFTDNSDENTQQAFEEYAQGTIQRKTGRRQNVTLCLQQKDPVLL